MDPKLKELIEKETGIVIDGKLTSNEIKAIYDYLKPVVDLLFPGLVDWEDKVIDMLEKIVLTRKGIRKTTGMAICHGVRVVLKCPDDDDNTTQF